MSEEYVDITMRMSGEDVEKALRAFEHLQERYNDELVIHLSHIGWTIHMTYGAAVAFVEDIHKGISDAL